MCAMNVNVSARRNKEDGDQEEGLSPEIWEVLSQWISKTQNDEGDANTLAYPGKMFSLLEKNLPWARYSIGSFDERNGRNISVENVSLRNHLSNRTEPRPNGFNIIQNISVDLPNAANQEGDPQSFSTDEKLMQSSDETNLLTNQNSPHPLVQHSQEDYTDFSPFVCPIPLLVFTPPTPNRTFSDDSIKSTTECDLETSFSRVHTERLGTFGPKLYGFVPSQVSENSQKAFASRSNSTAVSSVATQPFSFPRLNDLVITDSFPRSCSQPTVVMTARSMQSKTSSAFLHADLALTSSISKATRPNEVARFLSADTYPGNPVLHNKKGPQISIAPPILSQSQPANISQRITPKSNSCVISSQQVQEKKSANADLIMPRHTPDNPNWALAPHDDWRPRSGNQKSQQIAGKKVNKRSTPRPTSRDKDHIPPSTDSQPPHNRTAIPILHDKSQVTALINTQKRDGSLRSSSYPTIGHLLTDLSPIGLNKVTAPFFGKNNPVEPSSMSARVDIAELVTYPPRVDIFPCEAPAGTNPLLGKAVTMQFRPSSGAKSLYYDVRNRSACDNLSPNQKFLSSYDEPNNHRRLGETDRKSNSGRFAESKTLPTNQNRKLSPPSDLTLTLAFSSPQRLHSDFIKSSAEQSHSHIPPKNLILNSGSGYNASISCQKKDNRNTNNGFWKAQAESDPPYQDPGSDNSMLCNILMPHSGQLTPKVRPLASRNILEAPPKANTGNDLNASSDAVMSSLSHGMQKHRVTRTGPIMNSDSSSGRTFDWANSKKSSIYGCAQTIPTYFNLQTGVTSPLKNQYQDKYPHRLLTSQAELVDKICIQSLQDRSTVTRNSGQNIAFETGIDLQSLSCLDMSRRTADTYKSSTLDRHHYSRDLPDMHIATGAALPQVDSRFEPLHGTIKQ